MSRLRVALFAVVVGTGILTVVGVAAVNHADVPGPVEGEELSGGETTVFDTTENAFGYAARNLRSEMRNSFFVGNSFFKQNWVIAPASTSARDGLGPLFNARSCSACHFKDGRGRPPREGEEMVSMLLRLSRPGDADERAGVRPDETFGDQLQQNAIPGATGEGVPVVEYEEVVGTFADGESYSLRKPDYRIERGGYGDVPEDLEISPRVAPQMIGMGLLEAIPEEVIIAQADPDDLDGDGISGRPNWVWNHEVGVTQIGRFGWKANTATVREQVAGAFLGDMGLTSPTRTHGGASLSELGVASLAYEDEDEPEVTEKIFDHVVFYSSVLAVPARRDVDDPEVLVGKKLFDRLGCVACHVPEYQTGVIEDLPEVSGQRIFPYTDLLLHDMGDGLADGRADFQADGREWRTPPLWGIGLIENVNGHTEFLHDGRARNLEEAILWHGGEAEASRDAYKKLAADERAAVIAFLESL
ncbi:MAG: di-heme oxidoredictase family protein [Chthoniobacterales bacterium]